MRSHKKQRTRLNKTKVNVEAIWLECPELENKPHLLILCTLVRLGGGCGNASVNTCVACETIHAPGFPVAEHFNSASHSLDDMMICGLKRCSGDNTRRKTGEILSCQRVSKLLSSLSLQLHPTLQISL